MNLERKHDGKIKGKMNSQPYNSFVTCKSESWCMKTCFYWPGPSGMVLYQNSYLDSIFG